MMLTFLYITLMLQQIDINSSKRIHASEKDVVVECSYVEKVDLNFYQLKQTGQEEKSLPQFYQRRCYQHKFWATILARFPALCQALDIPFNQALQNAHLRRQRFVEKYVVHRQSYLRHSAHNIAPR